MNKLKVAGQDLRDHLGRDATGIALLNRLMMVANEQRTRCAAIETTNVNLVANDKKLRGELDAAQMRNESLQKKNERDADKLRSAESRVRVLVAQLATMQEPEELPPVLVGADRRQKVDQLFKRVLRRYKRMPGTSGDLQAIVVDDFIRVFTNDEFMSFGMVVAFLGLLGLAPSIVTEERLTASDQQHLADTDKFLDWFKNRVLPNRIVTNLINGTNPRESAQEMAHDAQEELSYIYGSE